MIKKIHGLGLTWKIVGGVVVLAVLGGIYHFWSAGKASPYQFVTVTQGPITEVVSVTGNTTPVKSLSLAFQNAGTIATVNYPVGADVGAGDVIATLDTQALRPARPSPSEHRRGTGNARKSPSRSYAAERRGLAGCGQLRSTDTNQYLSGNIQYPLFRLFERERCRPQSAERDVPESGNQQSPD